MEYESVTFKPGNPPVYWNDLPQKTHTVDLTPVCDYIVEKMFVVDLNLYWPKVRGNNPTPYWMIKVPKNCSAKYVREVIIPGTERLVGEYFEITLDKKEIVFKRKCCTQEKK